MILDAIRDAYALRPKPPGWQPTGSRFGTCTAQLQWLRHPEVSHPEPPTVRRRLMWEEGHLIEDWWGQTIERVFPNGGGSTQECFYFPVPLSLTGRAHIRHLIVTDQLWGVIRYHFRPPAVIGQSVANRLTERLGFVLDPAGPVVYAPTYVDRLFEDQQLGWVILEKKAMSNAGFRRALLGQVDTGIRDQVTGQATASGLPVVLLCYRKETAHLVELVFLPGVELTRVEIQTINGQVETYYAKADGTDTVLTAEGEPVSLPAEALWDRAITWTPYDPGRVALIQEHIRRVLLDGPIIREFGPEFTCPKCGGEGTKVCGRCKGTGVTEVKRNPCGPCVGVGKVTCAECGGAGQLDEAELGFPCSYCPVVQHCYAPAHVRLEINSKPHYRIRRAEWLASGVTVTPRGGG